MRSASMLLPLPGGPIISRLWPPAAAIVSARFGISWPRTSLRSSACERCAEIARGATRGKVVVPSRASTTSTKWVAA